MSDFADNAKIVMKMAENVRWCGFDFAGTLMDPRDMPRVFKEVLAEVFMELNNPQIIEEKISCTIELARKYSQEEQASKYGIDWFLAEAKGEERRLLKKMYPFRPLLNKGWGEFCAIVLNNDPNAIELFLKKRIRTHKPVIGLRKCLSYLEKKAITTNIVCDAMTQSILETVFNFLDFYDLWQFFHHIITPLGLFKGKQLMDASYKGLEKIDGAIYDKLVLDLHDVGIAPSEAIIIGDRPLDDIEMAKTRGFKAVQFIGVINRGPSSADYVISELAQLERII